MIRLPLIPSRSMFLAAVLLLARAAAGAPDTVTSFTLTTYNLHVGVPMGEEIGAYRAGWKDVQAQADVITSTASDLVALQEVDSEFGLVLPEPRHRSSLLPMPRILSHLTGMDYVFGSAQDDVRYPSDNARYVEWGSGDRWTNNGEAHGEVGNALLSRFPFVRTPENIALPRDEGKERRACLRAEIALPGFEKQPVVVYATHLQHDRPSSRVDQMRAILDRARRDTRGGALVFLLGDLNHITQGEAGGKEEEPNGTSPNPITLALESGFHDLHASFAAAQQTAPAATYPADTPRRRIDYIFCNRPLKVLEAEVLSTPASDHLPLRVAVELPGTGR